MAKESQRRSSLALAPVALYITDEILYQHNIPRAQCTRETQTRRLVLFGFPSVYAKVFRTRDLIGTGMLILHQS
jgi:hypothetical protein